MPPFKNIGLILFTALITITFSVYGTYQWQNKHFEKERQRGMETVEELKAEIKKLKESEKVVTISSPEIITLNEDALLDQDREYLETHLIEPFTLYYENPAITNLLSLTITVPDAFREPYKIEANFSGGEEAGLLFGSFGEVTEYWMPECMDTCPYSEEFKAAYPSLLR
jgi:hypothetical protein